MVFARKAVRCVGRGWLVGVLVSGALVSADITLEADERVTFDLDEFGEIPARVVHIRGSLIGLAFEFDQAGETKLRHWLEEIEKEGRA